MSKLFVSEHPLIHTKMAMLRDEQTGTKEFREIIGEVASLLLYEATRDLPLKEVQVKTPIATATCKTIDTKLAMVPILRAGLGMTDGLLNLLPAAKSDISVCIVMKPHWSLWNITASCLWILKNAPYF